MSTINTDLSGRGQLAVSHACGGCGARCGVTEVLLQGCWGSSHRMIENTGTNMKMKVCFDDVAWALVQVL
ncbi:hypothetical protein E2C01_000751 [Portunus trituberculatus]|uniref:Uncharacterized protein n=1 Tax=Portunus trituberculatus TaxID=210409 RepID=A0A5B7CHE8_PORTR|nr:hypothetical protein [Portunus trituberculatus]